MQRATGRGCDGPCKHNGERVSGCAGARRGARGRASRPVSADPRRVHMSPRHAPALLFILLFYPAGAQNRSRGGAGGGGRRRRRRLTLSPYAIPYSQLLLIGQMRATASMMNAYPLYGQQFAKPFIDSQLKVSIIVNRTIRHCCFYRNENICFKYV